MSLGEVRSILVCQPSSSSNGAGPCPTGQELMLVNAYVLTPEASTYIEQTSQPMDYSLLAQYMGLGFSTVMIAFCLAKGIGSIIKVVK